MKYRSTKLAKDVHAILKSMGFPNVQPPDCVSSVESLNDPASLFLYYYPFDIFPSVFGRYQYCISLRVKKNYTFEGLEKIVREKVKEEVVVGTILSKTRKKIYK